MDFGLYSNSYLKQFEAKQNYKDNDIKVSKILKPKPIIEFNKNNKLINQHLVQEHVNYIESKTNNKNTQTQLIKTDLKNQDFKIENKDRTIKSGINHIVKKDGYLSRFNKETTLFNKSICGYENHKKKNDYDVVSITRPIFWPDRGYVESSIVKGSKENDFKTCYLKKYFDKN